MYGKGRSPCTDCVHISRGGGGCYVIGIWRTWYVFKARSFALGCSVVFLHWGSNIHVKVWFRGGEGGGGGVGK